MPTADNLKIKINCLLNRLSTPSPVALIGSPGDADLNQHFSLLGRWCWLTAGWPTPQRAPLHAVVVSLTLEVLLTLLVVLVDRREGLSETNKNVDVDCAQRLVGESLRDVGMDPDTGQFDADVVKTGQSKSQRDRIKMAKRIIQDLEKEHVDGAPHEAIVEDAAEAGIERSSVKHEIEKLKRKGQIYETQSEYYRTS